MYKEILTSEEFKKRFNNNDEICVIAQAFAHNSFGGDYDLSTKQEYIRQTYLDKAYYTIEMLKKHGLIIIHENNTGSFNETK